MKEDISKSLVRKMSVKNRITLMVILISVFPILVISIFSYAKAYISVRETARSFASQSLVAVRRGLSELAEPQRMLAQEGSIAFPEGYAKTPERLFQPEYRQYLKGITIMDQSGQVLWSKGEDMPAPAEGAAWSLPINAEGEQRVVMVMEYPADSSKDHYLLQAVFSPQLLSQEMGFYDSESYNRLVLVDYAGNLVTDDGSQLTVLEREAIRQVDMQTIGGEPICPQGEKSSFLCCLSVPALNGTLVFIAPYTEMMKPLQSIFFGTLFCTILLLNFSVIVIDSIDRPMNALVRSFGNAARMNFEISEQDECHDELGILNNAFNEICVEMRETLRKVEQEQAEKRKAEIKMLQAQINPHFLFNTLDSLRFTSMMSNVPAVSDGLAALSHLLRSSILKDNSYVPLQSELQTVEDYLTLQRIRSCEMITLLQQISPKAEKASIMRLLLQPIVENSVIHGIRENVPLTIWISASVSEGKLHIWIRDDGKGFNPGQNDKDNVPKSSKMSGIGLHNVRDRLYLAYKDNQSFAIESTIGKGTQVSITMPFTAWEETTNV